MPDLFWVEAFVVVAGCLGYRSLAWAVAWSPVYLVGLVVFSSASFWGNVEAGIAVGLIALVAAAIGRGLRPAV